jgi:hypothetical protein
MAGPAGETRCEVATVHSFRERLEFSEQAGHEAFWQEVYRQAFPNLVNIMPCPGDTASQRMGIDRIILLANGKLLAIDEKKREADYPDILLEYVARDRDGAPGWIEKDLTIDYLAYAFMPSKRCYLLPWPFLRKAWEENKARWKADYRPVVAENRDYRTLSLPVPTDVLYRAVNRATLIQVV